MADTMSMSSDSSVAHPVLPDADGSEVAEPVWPTFSKQPLPHAGLLRHVRPDQDHAGHPAGPGDDGARTPVITPGPGRCRAQHGDRGQSVTENP
jgi:hypothetical protein